MSDQICTAAGEAKYHFVSPASEDTPYDRIRMAPPEIQLEGSVMKDSVLSVTLRGWAGSDRLGRAAAWREICCQGIALGGVDFWPIGALSRRWANDVCLPILFELACEKVRTQSGRCFTPRREAALSRRFVAYYCSAAFTNRRPT
jgi:hypothetical protein